MSGPHRMHRSMREVNSPCMDCHRQFDARTFIGCTLEQVCFTVNTVHLSFDKQGSVTIFQELRYRAGSQAESVSQMVPITESSVMSFIGRVVQSADARTDGTLTMQFGDGYELLLIE